jgi:hypothetical protein
MKIIKYNPHMNFQDFFILNLTYPFKKITVVILFFMLPLISLNNHSMYFTLIRAPIINDEKTYFF